MKLVFAERIHDVTGEKGLDLFVIKSEVMVPGEREKERQWSNFVSYVFWAQGNLCDDFFSPDLLNHNCLL